MKTEFTAAQLQDPVVAASANAIRACVHCGFCTSACPTYVLLGDELDSPRGRIYLMKDMLENETVPSPKVVEHIDRCLTCLSCTTACPSGVDYSRLLAHARSFIATRYQRAWDDRLLRWAISVLLPFPRRFAWSVRLGRLAAPVRKVFERLNQPRLAALLAMAQANPPRAFRHVDQLARGVRRGRVVIQRGCAEPVLRPQVREAAGRLFSRLGYDVSFAPEEGCCGALVSHLGEDEAALRFVRRNVDAWTRELELGGLSAIVIPASGCGTTIKDYGFLLRNDPAYAARAKALSALAKDVGEFLTPNDFHGAPDRPAVNIAYHAPCSLLHGQRSAAGPQRLLEAAGFVVSTPAEAHLCCGSAGTYALLQPAIADELGRRKADRLAALQPDAIATSNIGCAVHIGARTALPVVHVLELLDWASGGPRPQGLDTLEAATRKGMRDGAHA